MIIGEFKEFREVIEFKADTLVGCENQHGIWL